MVLLAGLLVVAGLAYARYRFDQIKKVHAKHLVAQAPAGKPFNILIVGSDSRAFVTNATQQKAFGSPALQAGQRSDVTMIARIVPATKQVWILSIPRDLWVDIPGDVPGVSGMNRINTAFNNGPDLLIQTIEQDLHIPINHYVSVNFNGFQSMVDALGGITMDFPMPLKDSYSGLKVNTTGCQVVPGTTALELVRSRHLYYLKDGYWQYDGQSDFSRIQRQDLFFRAVLAKLNGSITNPLAVNGFIGAAVHNLTIDDTLGESNLVSLATELHGLASENLHTQTLPTFGYTTAGGAQVLGEAQPYASQMLFQFNLVGLKPAAPTTTTHAGTGARHRARAGAERGRCGRGRGFRRSNAARRRFHDRRRGRRFRRRRRDLRDRVRRRRAPRGHAPGIAHLRWRPSHAHDLPACRGRHAHRGALVRRCDDTGPIRRCDGTGPIRHDVPASDDHDDGAGAGAGERLHQYAARALEPGSVPVLSSASSEQCQLWQCRALSSALPGQADLRRWRTMRRRSRSVMPPHTPSRSRCAKACSRHA